MASWTDGYVADIGYTFGFYREMTPAILRQALLSAGSTACSTPTSYCELGCGQGFSATLLAAANPDISFHATDFNPSQIGNAASFASEAGVSNVSFYDTSFAEFAEQTGLPESFDIIALHGIYSWISADNRRHIVDFIRRKLKVGGIVYISYNSLPGWAPMMPLRRLMADHATGGTGALASRIESAVGFVESLIASKANYFSQNTNVAPRFDKIKSMSRNYLAHEYFNRDWTPFYFSDVANELSAAKLSFVTSSHMLDHIDALNMTEEQQAILRSIKDVVQRECLRDFFVNQQFRRDVFLKGPRELPGYESLRQWREQRFALTTPRISVPLKVSGALGEAGLQENVYTPLLDGLTNGPATVDQLLVNPAVNLLGWPKIVQALTVLVGSGHVQPCLPAKDDSRRSQRTKQFNAAVMKRAEWTSDLQYLASPVTGGGTTVDRVTLLFLKALMSKHADPVQFVWGILAPQGNKIIKDGVAVESETDNISELRLRYADLIEKRLPVFKQLGIA